MRKHKAQYTKDQTKHKIAKHKESCNLERQCYTDGYYLMLINLDMTTTIAITKARVNLGSIVKRVHLKKERFILEKDGYPVAALIDIDEFEDYLDSQDEGLKKQIRASRKEFDAGKGKSADEFLMCLKKRYHMR